MTAWETRPARPLDWDKPKLRYRAPWHWHWWRIYVAIFWLVIVPILVSFVGWR